MKKLLSILASAIVLALPMVAVTTVQAASHTGAPMAVPAATPAVPAAKADKAMAAPAKKMKKAKKAKRHSKAKRVKMAQKPA